MAGTLGTLFVLPRYQGVYQGVFAAGAKLEFYEAGTTTPLATYTSQDLSVANANPVVADAYGLFGPIYLLDRAYKVVLKTSGGVEIWSQDNVRPYSVPALNRVDPSICDGRLTLASGTPVTTADVTAATTVYFTPYQGNRIALYNATYGWDLFEFAELSIALGTDAASLPYDVFAYINAGAVAIERLAWTNGTTQATALTTQNGVLVKSGDPTRRYLGTYRTTAVIGQTEDSALKRFVWNYTHRLDRSLLVNDTASWTYSSGVWRQANNSDANRAEVVIGVAEDPVYVTVSAMVANSVVVNAITTYAAVGVGVDSVTVQSTVTNSQWAHPYVAAIPAMARSEGAFAVAAGYHYFAWLEYANVTNGGVFTWYGREPNQLTARGGLVGLVRG